MNTIPLSPEGDPKIRQALSEEIQESIHQYQHDTNISDGGEFLDDALRMKEQPLGAMMAKDNEQPFTDD
jgi:DNA-binding protein Fis